MKQIVVFLGLATVLISCGGNGLDYNDECGPLTEFKIDENYCEKFGLRAENFTLLYPSELTVETQEDYKSGNYVDFFKNDEAETIVECINIGSYSGIIESTEGGMGFFGITKGRLLKSLVGQFREQGLDMQYVTYRDEKIGDQLYFTARGKFTVDREIAGFRGTYITQMILVPKAEVEGEGFLVMMMAREDSGVQLFEDFATTSCLAPILLSFD